jgi:hypothetical protein
MKEVSWLQAELKRAKKQGLTVQIEGRECEYHNPEEFAYVLEEPGYMLDYVSDETGKITGICFDKIKEDDVSGA